MAEHQTQDNDMVQDRAPAPGQQAFVDSHLGFCYAASWLIGLLPLSTIATMTHKLGTHAMPILDILFYTGEFYFFFSVIGCLLTALGFTWVEEIQVKYPRYRRSRLLRLLYLADVILIVTLHVWLFNKIAASTPALGLG